MKKIFNSIKIFSLLATTLMLATTPVYATTLDDLYQQKKDIQDSIAANKQEMRSLQDLIDNLNAQTMATQKQIDITNQIIDLTNQQIVQTQAQIEQKQKELDKKKADLNEAVITYYETGTPSTLEIIASANNLSSIIDQSQYMQALSDQINTQAQQIAQIKTDLENQKKDLEKKEADLEGQRTSLTDQQRNLNIQTDAKNRLLTQEKNEQSQLKADLDNVSEAIYAERQRLGGYISGGTGGYPWANASDTECNYSNDPYGFCFRQCTSYAAWYWNAIEGKSWYNTRPGSGSAWNWPALAQDQGYSVSSTPRPGAIASWDKGGIFGTWGHVAIVQSVNPNGTINISEYNWWPPLSYSERNNVSPAGARFIY